MSDNFIPKAFENMVDDPELAAEQLIDDVNSKFAPLGIQTRIEKGGTRNTCEKCNTVITGRGLVVQGKNYHPRCFECSKCARPIQNDPYTIVDDNPVCKKCVDWEEKENQKNAPAPKLKPVGKQQPSGQSVSSGRGKSPQPAQSGVDGRGGFEANPCSRCHLPPMISVNFEGEVICGNCFVCEDCKDPIDPTKGFMPKDGKFYCPTCAERAHNKGIAERSQVGSKNCVKCGKVIRGNFVKADDDEAYHKECFRCDGCNGSLSNGYAKKGQKNFCGDCTQNMINERVYENQVRDEPVQGFRVDPRSGNRRANDAPAPALYDTVNCRSCQTPCAKGTKFCGNCGAPQQKVCGSCGTPASGKFCGECGTEVQ